MGRWSLKRSLFTQNGSYRINFMLLNMSKVRNLQPFDFQFILLSRRISLKWNYYAATGSKEKFWMLSRVIGVWIVTLFMNGWSCCRLHLRRRRRHRLSDGFVARFRILMFRANATTQIFGQSRVFAALFFSLHIFINEKFMRITQRDLSRNIFTLNYCVQAYECLLIVVYIICLIIIITYYTLYNRS